MGRARQFARVYTEKQVEALIKLRTPMGLPWAGATCRS